MDSSYTVQDVHTFVVTANDTEGCQQNEFVGMYKLQVGQAVLQLLHPVSGKEVTHWPLRWMRKFGFTSHTFFLFAGTRCKTGAGKFIFFTLEGKKIAQLLSLQAVQIADQGNKLGNEEVKPIHIRKDKDRRKDAECTEQKYIASPSYSNVKKEDLGKVDRKIHEQLLHRHGQPVTDGNETKGIHPYENVGRVVTSNEQRHNVATEKYNGLQSVSSGKNPVVFPPSNEEEEDYYNSGLYSHLNRNEPHFQENEYGMASAVAQLNFAGKGGLPKTKKVDSSKYEYVS